jgi:hypothetical protein
MTVATNRRSRDRHAERGILVTHSNDPTPAASPVDDPALGDMIRRVVDLYRSFKPSAMKAFRVARRRAHAQFGRHARIVGHPQLDGTCHWQLTIRSPRTGEAIAKTRFHPEPMAAVDEALGLRDAAAHDRNATILSGEAPSQWSAPNHRRPAGSSRPLF